MVSVDGGGLEEEEYDGFVDMNLFDTTLEEEEYFNFADMNLFETTECPPAPVGVRSKGRDLRQRRQGKKFLEPGNCSQLNCDCESEDNGLSTLSMLEAVAEDGKMEELTTEQTEAVDKFVVDYAKNLSKSQTRIEKNLIVNEDNDDVAEGQESDAWTSYLALRAGKSEAEYEPPWITASKGKRTMGTTVTGQSRSASPLWGGSPVLTMTTGGRNMNTKP